MRSPKTSSSASFASPNAEAQSVLPFSNVTPKYVPVHKDRGRARLCENLLGCEEKCAAELIIRKQLGVFLHKIDVLEG